MDIKSQQIEKLKDMTQKLLARNGQLVTQKSMLEDRLLALESVNKKSLTDYLSLDFSVISDSSFDRFQGDFVMLAAGPHKFYAIIIDIQGTVCSVLLLNSFLRFRIFDIPVINTFKSKFISLKCLLSLIKK